MIASSAGVDCPQAKAFLVIVQAIGGIGIQLRCDSQYQTAHQNIQSMVSSSSFSCLLIAEDWGRKG